MNNPGVRRLKNNIKPRCNKNKKKKYPHTHPISET